MVKKGKLKQALEGQKGIDPLRARQKLLRKKAEKTKRLKRKRGDFEDEEDESQSGFSGSDEEGGGVSIEHSSMMDFPDVHLSDDEINGTEESTKAKKNHDKMAVDGEDSEDEDFESEFGSESEASEQDLELDQGAESGLENEDIPLSDLEDLSEGETGDVMPHQRLTINNTTALLKALKSIALPISTLPFSDHQTIISDEQIEIEDVDDDINREKVFYQQSLAAAVEGRARLRKEGVPFSRPPDYFAEMVKTDEHMGKIKSKAADDKASKLASAEAKRQRDLRKFGKQVQVAKMQERDKAKRETLEKIQILKKQRKSGDMGDVQEDDMFDIALDNAAQKEKRGNDFRKGRAPAGKSKRELKDKKFGYGGKKRFGKSGDAISSGDLSGFSVKKMKAAPKGTRRLGKSKRLKSKA